METKALIETPIGYIEIIELDGYIKGLYFRDDEPGETIPESLANAADQIKRYFRGELQAFDIAVNPTGTEFQLSVWELLSGIPYGSTATYGAIANKLGIKNGARAVGLANGANPVSIIIPCHRVIGQNGKLTGYAGGLWRKEWLLKMEHSTPETGLFARQN